MVLTEIDRARKRRPIAHPCTATHRRDTCACTNAPLVVMRRWRFDTAAHTEDGIPHQDLDRSARCSPRAAVTSPRAAPRIGVRCWAYLSRLTHSVIAIALSKGDHAP